MRNITKIVRLFLCTPSMNGLTEHIFQYITDVTVGEFQGHCAVWSKEEYH